MKVLFVGNSHTYYNDMPQIFADMCKEKGKNVEVTMQAHGGVTYGWHYSQMNELRFALMYGGYDYLVMQQAAHVPCPSKEETITDAEKIINLARKCGVKVIVAMPWAERDYQDHQKIMYDTYYILRDKFDVKLTCTGNVFEEVYNTHPEINMYWVDGQHASPYGSYTAAMGAFKAIFAESVKGLSSNAYENYPVSEEDYRLVHEANLKAQAEPDNKELKEELMRLYHEKIVPVCDKEKAKVVLDAEKTAVLQELVDKLG